MIEHAQPLNARKIGTAAFTLVEVLAAIAILAIWYMVIAAMAADGLRHQGESRRRLEAGLIADRVMAEVEIPTLDGSVPKTINEETEEGDYLINVLISPFVFGNDQAQAAMQTALRALMNKSDTRDPQSTDPTLASRDMQTLLATKMPGITNNLYTISVNVAWEEGFSTRSVARTSYFFDLVSAREIYQDEETESTGDGLNDEDDDRDETDRMGEE